jgi:hypothetical protein
MTVASTVGHRRGADAVQQEHDLIGAGRVEETDDAEEANGARARGALIGEAGKPAAQALGHVGRPEDIAAGEAGEIRGEARRVRARFRAQVGRDRPPHRASALPCAPPAAPDSTPGADRRPTAHPTR